MDTAPYAPGREVEDIEALINEVGGPVFLYSHFSGAAITLKLQSNFANRLGNWPYTKRRTLWIVTLAKLPKSIMVSSRNCCLWTQW